MQTGSQPLTWDLSPPVSAWHQPSFANCSCFLFDGRYLAGSRSTLWSVKEYRGLGELLTSDLSCFCAACSLVCRLTGIKDACVNFLPRTVFMCGQEAFPVVLTLISHPRAHCLTFLQGGDCRPDNVSRQSQGYLRGSRKPGEEEGRVMEIGNVFSSSSCGIVPRCMQVHCSAPPGSQIQEIIREREAAPLPPACLASTRGTLVLSWCMVGQPWVSAVFQIFTFPVRRKQRVDRCWVCMLSHPHQYRAGCASSPCLHGIPRSDRRWILTRICQIGIVPQKLCHPCPSGGAAPFQSSYPLCRMKYFLNIRKLSDWSLLSLSLFEGSSCHFQ